MSVSRTAALLAVARTALGAPAATAVAQSPASDRARLNLDIPVTGPDRARPAYTLQPARKRTGTFALPAADA